MWRRQATSETQAQTAVLVVSAQRGDRAARDAVINNLSPFALLTARSVTGRPIGTADEEYSIALLAINEAIDSFDDGKGASFTTFAETVIRRRLIDYLRRQSRMRELPRSTLSRTAEGDEYEDIPAEVNAAEQAYRENQLVFERRLEIEALLQALAQFGLTLAELAQQTPKHTDARATAIGVAAALVSDGALWEECLRTKLLPVAALCERQMISRKTVERYRKYIIAVALILGGDYPLLRRYVEVGKNG